MKGEKEEGERNEATNKKKTENTERDAEQRICRGITFYSENELCKYLKFMFILQVLWSIRDKESSLLYDK